MDSLPADAEKRLRGKVFTSDLSVDELVCLHELGARPLGLVMGSSIYHVGLQLGSWSQNQELTVSSQAMHTARALAVGRMVAEAAEIGGDGIVGVDFRINRYEWGPELVEFVAVGTAIAGPEDDGWKPATGMPFSSGLSAQDLWKLIRIGYRPVGLAMGNCVYHVAHQSLRQTLAKVGRNAEMETFTQATYDAREIAMTRLQAEAEGYGAQGVVGAHVEESSWMWGGHVIEFFALGTAVVRAGDASPSTPQLVLGLDH